jgi:integrase/recombinase XerD
MSIVKVILRKKYKADGTSPLTLRITKDRKSSYIYLGYHILEKDWDAVQQKVKKSYPNSVRLNNLLMKKLSEASDKAIELDTNREHVSSKAVKLKIKPKGGHSFFGQAELYLATLKEAGKYNQYTADKPRINHFKDFLDGRDIAFSDINVALLERFKHYCLTDLKVGERTAINHLAVVRSIYSQAIKNELADTKNYPFGKGKIVIKFPQTTKVGLNIEDIRKLENVILSEANQHHARNLWLFSYYFAGIRVSDLLRLKWSDFSDDRLYYTMGKNLKTGSLKIPERAKFILAQYEAIKQHKDDYIFPELKNLDTDNNFSIQRRIAHTASRIDKILRLQVAPIAKITSKLTMHIARHSFATIAGDKISLNVLQGMFRHSTLLVTAGYMGNFTNQQADDALDLVLNFEPE